MSALRIVFFGTPAFAVPTLERSSPRGTQVVAVVTQPDRPRGRGQRLAARGRQARGGGARPARAAARPAEGRRTFWPRCASLEPDLGVVAAYGQILPARGPATCRARLDQRARLAAAALARRGADPPRHPRRRSRDGRDDHAGRAALDAGPMLARTAVAIDPDETSAELEATAGGDRRRSARRASPISSRAAPCRRSSRTRRSSPTPRGSRARMRHSTGRGPPACSTIRSAGSIRGRSSPCAGRIAG